MAVGGLLLPPEVDANPCQELVEREGLRQVVAGAEPEAVQLRRQVGPRRDDHDRQAWLPRLERAEHTQPVEARQEQVEDDQVAAQSFGKAEPLLAVSRSENGEAFGLESTRDEVQDPRLIFDDEN